VEQPKKDKGYSDEWFKKLMKEIDSEDWDRYMQKTREREEQKYRIFMGLYGKRET
jgi:hypothetical protein